ncbi:FMN-binding negative transcriptional regulator, partial [Streptomyces sp. NPDC059524]|uniref:FMN-binding negative transcriptional regulator n=1 Tax=Streptomyces sp. NPDC059524 TaxID=3346856 RepID=UPI0036757B64
MLIHPWDAARDGKEWQDWLAGHDFGQLAVNGGDGEPPFVQPLHFAYDAGRGEVLGHLARPNPLWGGPGGAPPRAGTRAGGAPPGEGGPPP